MLLVIESPYSRRTRWNAGDMTWSRQSLIHGSTPGTSSRQINPSDASPHCQFEHCRDTWCYVKFDRDCWHTRVAEDKKLRNESLLEAMKHWTAREWISERNGLASTTRLHVLMVAYHAMSRSLQGLAIVATLTVRAVFAMKLGNLKRVFNSLEKIRLASWQHLYCSIICSMLLLSA